MTKRLLYILLVIVMLGAPLRSQASTMIEIIETEIQNVGIAVSESTVHVTNANGQVMQVYNLAGVLVKSVKVEGADKRIELNLPKGCYIVKVGKTVRKISIK